MLLLYYIHWLLSLIYRGVFSVGVVAVQGRQLSSVNVLTDYSYINNALGRGDRLVRCLTGLGPTSTSKNANANLGGMYFNGIMILIRDESVSCGPDIILVRPGAGIAGVINIDQCGVFSTAVEGVYTCTMMNSAMMNESVRFGVYFTGRSE